MGPGVTTHPLLAPKFSRGRAVPLATLRACLTCYGTSCCLHVHNTQVGVQNCKFKSLKLCLYFFFFGLFYNDVSVSEL